MVDEKVINVASPVVQDMITPYFTKLVDANIKIELYVLDISKFVNRYKSLYSTTDATVFKLHIEHTLFNLDKLIYADDMKTIDSVIDAVQYLVKNDLDNMPYIEIEYIPDYIDEEFYILITETIDFIYNKISNKDNLIIINWDEILIKTTITLLGYDGISLDSIVT